MLGTPQRPIILTPEAAPEEIYPYRRVWRSVAIEVGAMIGLVIFVFITVRLGFLREVPSRNWGGLMILIPLGMYLWFSVRGEQQAQHPREGLLTVTLFSALLANGVGLPLVDNIFVPREWLSDAGFFSRVLGYAFTAGVTAEFLKYIAIRYTTFPANFRVRMDGVAYSVAASIGYATVLNFQVVFELEPTVSSQAIRIAVNFISQVSIGTIMGFFMAQLALVPRRNSFFLGIGLFIASIVSGMFTGFRAIAAGSGFAVSSINGLFVIIGLGMAVMFAINFLIQNADGRDAARKENPIPVITP